MLSDDFPILKLTDKFLYLIALHRRHAAATRHAFAFS
jgi:hypothetical protein